MLLGFSEQPTELNIAQNIKNVKFGFITSCLTTST